MAAEVATPEEFVTAVLIPPANVRLGPVAAGGVNVTVVLASGLPPASVTVTTSGEAKAVFTGALCPLPAVMETFAGGPTVLVSAKLAVLAGPDEATILYAPACEFAVTETVALPEASVTAVFTPPENVTLAPDAAGAVNVTMAP